MTCGFCGEQIPEDTLICPCCNELLTEPSDPDVPVQQELPTDQQPREEPPMELRLPEQQETDRPPRTDAENDTGDLGMQAVTLGIAGLILGLSGIPGLVFSLLGMKRADAALEKSGTLDRKANTGKVLSRIGLFLSIASMAATAVGLIFLLRSIFRYLY